MNDALYLHKPSPLTCLHCGLGRYDGTRPLSKCAMNASHHDCPAEEMIRRT